MSSNLPEEGCRLAPDQPSSMKYVSPQQALHPTVDKEPTNAKPATRAAQLSIVNLLYNPGYPSTSPPQINGRPEDDGNRRSSAVGDQRIPPRTIADNENAVALAIDELSDEAQLEIEKIFIGSYFSNKHYIHPMLCKNAFMRRCEQEAFVASKRRAFCRRSSKFKGLYFAVVALGAINASPNETSLLDHYSSCSADGQKYSFAGKPSALDFADFYFGITKQALGDIFESCSLESAQTLLLLANNCGSHDPEAEEDDVAMIPVMVALAQIMSEASHLLYHSPKRPMSEMSQIAMSLDNKLEEWKSNLPSFLNVDVASLNDSEWAFKQKLVLRLSISKEELLKDVEKSLEIFDSMTNIVVARRCSEMIREVLDVARACVARRRAVSAVPILPPHADTNIDSSSLEANDDQSVHTRTDMAPLASQGEDGDFFFSLFNQDAQPDTRAEILANLVDPTILEDFAFGNGGNDFSYFLGL
ncbi:hypothetical protein APSETT444_008243 [Aspergillus pseudonomiae]